VTASAPVAVLIQQLDDGLPLPAYAHPGDAGADLVTSIDVELAPGERAMVPTGVAIALPEGYAAFVHPRSGLAARFGVGIVNAPGTVDAGYRGEIKVLLVNHDATTPVRLFRGDRIAQLVVQRVEQAIFHPVDVLPDSARGAGGCGSTGGFTDRAPQTATQTGRQPVREGTT
jgi:dUTP pyrophosphatase